MKKFILFLSFHAITIVIFAQTPIINPPQKTATIVIDNNGNNKADPNDKIRYKTTIINSGTGNATGVTYSVSIDGKTTLVAGSFKSSPLAINDTYACTGNVGLNVPASLGLMANDFDDTPAGLACTAGTFATTQSGSITISANGSFTYSPPVGFTGSDTYAYTLNDGNAVAGVATTDNATIIFTVSNMIWFIDNSSVAATSDGRLASPFKTLANFNAATTLAGQLIFIKNTGTNYTGGIVLKNTQTLFGTGHTGGANLANVLPFSLATNSNTLPAINGTRPGILNSSGDGITLGSANTIRGVDVGNCSDFGIDANNLAIGALTLSEVSIVNSTGGGFRADNGSGALNVAFTNISSTGGTNGINLTNCAGTFTVGGGTITNPTGTGVLVSGGSVVFTTNTNITDNSGFVIDVDNHDSGNVTFQVGTITSTANGIRVQNCGGGTITFSGTSKSLTTGANTAVSLASNTGATINFTGGVLVLNSTSATALNVTAGGTFTVQGTGNTITSTTGTALNVVNTTIGASGLTFQSISSNGGTNGIVLNGSSGNLTVTGDGSGQANGSGGSLANITGGVLGNAPVYCLTASGTITLKSMNMSLNTNCYSGMLVDNNAGGTITANITGCTFIGVTSSVVQNKSLLQFEAGGAANVTGNVQNSYFSSNRTYGMFATAAGTSVMNITLNQSGFGTNINTGAAVNKPGSVITNPPPFSLGITNGSSAQVAYTITNNTFWGALGSLGALYAVTISGASTTASSKLNGTISGNQIGKAGTTGSGCSGNCAGLGLLPGTSGTFNATVNNNDIRQVNAMGINFVNSVTGANGTSVGHFTNNTLAEPDVTNAPLFQRAIAVLPGNSNGASANWCTQITGNNISGAWASTQVIRISTLNTTGVLTIPGLSPSSGATGAQISTYLQSLNTLPVGTSNNITVGGPINGGSPCPTN